MRAEIRDIIAENHNRRQEIYGPYEITAENGNVLVKYESGLENGYKLVTLDGNGKLVSVREEHTEQ